MTQEEYIEQRIDKQKKWYSEKSSKCQKKYKTWQVIKIIALLFITIVSLWGDREKEFPNFSQYVSYIVGALGAFVIFIESFLKIYDYKKLWVQYRLASESLNREKLRFETNTEPYDKPEPFKLFVQNCESIMRGENKGWEEILAEEDKT